MKIAEFELLIMPHNLHETPTSVFVSSLEVTPSHTPEYTPFPNHESVSI